MPALYPFGTVSYQRGMIAVAGTAFFVDSGHANAADANTQGRTPELPFATIDFAVGQCTANNGDVIFVMPGHAETMGSSTLVTLDVGGVTIRGLGVGGSKPTLTGSANAADLISVTGDNCQISNIRLVGAASAITSVLDINADDFLLGGDYPGDGVDILTGAAPVDIITVAGGVRGRIANCYFLGTAAGADNAIMFQAGSGSCDSWIVEDTLFNYLQYDIDENIIDIPADAHPGLIVRRCQMLGLVVAALTIKSSVANQFGFIEDCTLVAHAAAATIANLLGTTIEGMFVGRNVYGTDTTKTERSGPIPTTTPA